jgi:hypothetical protein
MVITDTLEARIPALLAADTATLNQAADALQVKLVKAAFTPGRLTRAEDLEIAAGAGMVPKAAGVGAALVGFDPNRNSWKVILREPAGGWQFISTAVADPIETIYGYVVTNLAGDETYGSDLLPNALTVPVGAVGVIVSLPEVVVWIPVGVFTGEPSIDEE